MIENYSKTVVQFLNNNEDIRKEVEALIYEMLEDKFGEKLSYSDNEITIILKELGSPYILAMKYTNLPKQIVSEKNIYKFYYIYAIIMIFNVIGFVFSLVFNSIASPRYFVEEFFQSIGGFIVSSLVSFAILAIVFMLMEHFNKEINLPHNPSKVKPNTKEKELKKKRKYSISEQIFEIFFTTVFLIFVSFFISYIVLVDGNISIEVFNEGYIQSVLWVITLIGAISILFCIYRIVSPRKTIVKELSFYSFGIASAVIYSIILLNLEIFNQAFIDYIKGSQLLGELYTKYEMLVLQVPVISVIVIIVVIETISLLVNLHRIFVNRYVD